MVHPNNHALTTAALVDPVVLTPGAVSRRWVVLVAQSDARQGALRGDAFRRKLARLLAATAAIPPMRTMALVLEVESPWWTPVLAHLPRANLLEQPFDRGTATGVALALLQILERDPDAELVVLTLDADPELAAEAVENCVLAKDEATLLCAREQGELTLSAGPAGTLLHLFRRGAPDLVATMLATLRRAHETRTVDLDEIYPFLPVVDLGRDVLGVGEEPMLARHSA